MAAHFIALSDLHLGYDESVLNDPKAQENLANEMAVICGGQAGRLVLNGDCFEGCVPRDAGEHDRYGYPPSMATAARSFFEKVTERIKFESLILVWGNHDYAMWKRLAASCGVPVFTNNLKGDVLLQRDGEIIKGANSFIEDVIGPASKKFPRIRSAYPNYILGRYWPYLVFHHGHLLDDLVLGGHGDAAYLALRLLIGEGKPTVNIGGEETIESIHKKTDAFIAAMWKFNSNVREEEWAIIRRGNEGKRCPSFPDEVASAWKIVTEEKQAEPLGRLAPWYINTLMADATTPGAIGPTTHPCYLFIGHDHGGGTMDISALDGRPWKLINTGGWTADGGCREPHSHVVVWNTSDDKPISVCVKIA